MMRHPGRAAWVMSVFALVSSQEAMADACCTGVTCQDVQASACVAASGDHFIGGDCTTPRACCSATDTGNVCDDRTPCDCVANGGIVGDASCASGCCGLQAGPIPSLPPQFADIDQLCASFHGFPAPPNLIPPADPVPQDYVDDHLKDFLIKRNYTLLGWIGDRDIRVFEEYSGTPPGAECTRHPGMKVYYSPEIVEWLCEARCSVTTGQRCYPGSCPGGETCVRSASAFAPGSMIVLEERPYSSITLDASNDMWLDPTCYDDLPIHWAAMVRGGAQPDWLWLEGDIAGESYAYSKGSCLACHSTAPSGEVFANAGNMLETQVYYEHQPPAGNATGFEISDGFGLGFLGGQAGWATFGSLVDPIISGANPSGGLQHLRLAGDPGVPQGTAIGGTSATVAPVFGPGEKVILSLDVNIGATGGADYFIEMVDSTAGLISARVDFSFSDVDGDALPGDILVIDPDGPNQVGGGFVFTGAEYIPGTYASFRIVNTLGGSLAYYYDGSLIYSDPNGLVPFGGSSSFDQAAVYSDNFHSGEVGDFDRFLIEFEVRIGFSDKVTIAWPTTSGLSYNVYRGDLSGLPGNSECKNAMDSDLADTVFTDPELPTSGAGFHYLVSVVDPCGESSLGSDSDGQPRTAAIPCP